MLCQNCKIMYVWSSTSDPYYTTTFTHWTYSLFVMTCQTSSVRFQCHLSVFILWYQWLSYLTVWAECIWFHGCMLWHNNDVFHWLLVSDDDPVKFDVCSFMVFHDALWLMKLLALQSDNHLNHKMRSSNRINEWTSSTLILLVIIDICYNLWFEWVLFIYTYFCTMYLPYIAIPTIYIATLPSLRRNNIRCC